MIRKYVLCFFKMPLALSKCGVEIVVCYGLATNWSEYTYNYMEGEWKDMMRRIGIITGLTLLLTLFACNSPNSPGTESSLNVIYQYGLYDNFESPSLNSTLWTGMAEIAYEEGNHVAAMSQSGVGKKQIVMGWPQSIPAEKFQEWSTRIKLSKDSSAEDFIAGFEYCGQVGDLGWCAQIGLRFKENTGVIYASWRNPAAGENLYETAGEVVPEKWYTLKIIMRPRMDEKVIMDFYLDERLFASWVTSDGYETLGSQVLSPQRRLLVEVLSGPSKKAVCLFDDVFGVYGDSPSVL